ncbi:hypothetical protein CURTO8I2_170082 [Curtobacterium sp. 8I-2]|nr:hypothetical protein CURTO8I2_170082 [Curtobacterium sp. 8I-2]
MFAPTNTDRRPGTREKGSSDAVSGCAGPTPSGRYTGGGMRIGVGRIGAWQTSSSRPNSSPPTVASAAVRRRSAVHSSRHS